MNHILVLISFIFLIQLHIRFFFFGVILVLIINQRSFNVFFQFFDFVLPPSGVVRTRSLINWWLLALKIEQIKWNYTDLILNNVFNWTFVVETCHFLWTSLRNTVVYFTIFMRAKPLFLFFGHVKTMDNMRIIVECEHF